MQLRASLTSVLECILKFGVLELTFLSGAWKVRFGQFGFDQALEIGNTCTSNVLKNRRKDHYGIRRYTPTPSIAIAIKIYIYCSSYYYVCIIEHIKSQAIRKKAKSPVGFTFALFCDQLLRARALSTITNQSPVTEGYLQTIPLKLKKYREYWAKS